MIKNIIFDFGDVFINLDKAATLRELNRLGLNELDPELLQLFQAYEKGVLTTAVFMEEAKAFFPAARSADLTAAWNAILLDFPEYRLHFLESFFKTTSYRMFLLSNTNALHMAHVAQTMGKPRYERFLNCFQHVYLSYEMQMRKPDPEIFQYVLDRHKLKPEETLFIDDTLENIIVASDLGISVWHINPEEEDIVNLDKKLIHG
ncbi:MAG: HAD family phosphatase [Eudoraea sp.]|nr:HAD family phosphatase [Eudoraea sp.]MBT8322954.1 HAD family phosphatase [Eudoraea sp.]